MFSSASQGDSASSSSTAGGGGLSPGPDPKRPQPMLFHTRPLQSMCKSRQKAAKVPVVHCRRVEMDRTLSPTEIARQHMTASWGKSADPEILQLSAGSSVRPTPGGVGPPSRKQRTSVQTRRKSLFVGHGQEDLGRRISMNFQTAADSVRVEERVAQDAASTFDIVKLARALNMTAEEVRKAKTVFDTLDEDDSRLLEYHEFERAVNLLLQEQHKKIPPSCVRALCSAHWSKSDRDKSGTIDFDEFLRWWATNRFKEELMLSEEERNLRDLARKYGVNEDSLQHIKLCFDAYDTDHSGIIDLREFRGILYKIMRVPHGVELPEGRVRSLWHELDRDGSGEAGFDEFLPWWLNRSETLLPYEAFYQRIRNLRDIRRDPPAYRAKPAATSAPADEPIVEVPALSAVAE